MQVDNRDPKKTVIIYFTVVDYDPDDKKYVLYFPPYVYAVLDDSGKPTSKVSRLKETDSILRLTERE